VIASRSPLDAGMRRHGEQKEWHQGILGGKHRLREPACQRRTPEAQETLTCKKQLSRSAAGENHFFWASEEPRSPKSCLGINNVGGQLVTGRVAHLFSTPVSLEKGGKRGQPELRNLFFRTVEIDGLNPPMRPLATSC